jgi:uncharacterized membrane protein
MAREELEANEKYAFLEWRREMADLEENKGYLLTPFEKNLEVWRQLWRVLERSQLLCQIVDGRNPLLFRCAELEHYVHDIDPSKRCLLLINKADLLTERQRRAWASYFREKGIDFVFWSAAVLVSAFSWAFFSFKSTGYTLPRNVLVMTFYELVIAAFALLGVGAVTGERLDFSVVTQSSWRALSWLVLASIIGFSAYGWLLNKAPLSLTSTYAYVNPVVAVLLGSLILGEPLTRDVIVGFTVVLGGVILVINGERRTR